MKQLGVLALVASLAFSSVVGCSSSDESGGGTPASDTQDVTSSRDIAASTRAEHGALGGLWSVRKIDNDQVSLALYETGGGDPAMNGNLVYLGAFGEHGGGGVFDLGINIVEVKKAEMAGPNTIKITGIQDTMGDDGAIKPGQPFEATVKFTVKDGQDGIEVEKKVVVTQKGASADVNATTDAGEDFMGSIYKLTRADDENVHARLFEQTGGDPAMNGVMPFLSIGLEMEEKTFDLGLNVANITKLEFKTPTELRLETLEDTMTADGAITPKPAFYSIKFSIANDRPGDKIKLTKLAR